MNPASTTFVLGYHGCDASLPERIFAGEKSLTQSANDYDWLGHGVYFWEHNAQRAYEFACEVRDRNRRRRRRLRRPTVVGAIIDLGFCLNLLDSGFIGMLKQAYLDLIVLHQEAAEPLPQNSGGKDRLLRHLDCAVIELLHATRRERRELAFDTVRAPFVEGTPIYAGAGFHDKSHLQLCVRNVGSRVFPAARRER